jgi:hypothetical protein
MARGPANISSPDVIKKFRAHFVKFTEDSRTALEGMQADITRVQQWLETEQTAHWKAQFRRRQEAYEKAKREYTTARSGSGPLRKTSCVDEKKAMDRAARLVEEAEAKLRAISKWRQVIDHDVRNAMGPCASFSSLLTTLGPKALLRLDQMLDRLDEYLRPGASTGAGPGGDTA